MTFLYLTLYLVFIGFVFRVASRVSRKSLIDIILTAHILFCASVIGTGFVLSAIDRTDDRRFWAIGVFVPVILFYTIFKKVFHQEEVERFTIFELIGSRIQLVWNWFGGLSLLLKYIFGGLLATFAIVEITNLLLICFTPPNEWDSMTGHLNRLLYYLQHHTMAHFGGTNWNMDTYPKSICTLQIYHYLMSGKVENFFKAIHHASYLILGLSMFGTVRNLTNNLTASVFCGLIIWLLPDVLMQSITTETDVVLAAYLSCFVYFLFSFNTTKLIRYLYLAGITFGITLGHKITFVFSLPPLFFIILYAVFYDDGGSVQTLKEWFALAWLRFRHFAFAIFIGLCFFTFPTGYIKNIQVFHHPIGPPTALYHQSIERAGTKKNLLIQGSRNIIRYSIDLINMDGLRNWTVGETINREMKKPIIWLEKKSPLRLEEKTDYTIIPFTYNRRFEFFNSNPYWGVFGFALILPLFVLTMLGVLRVKKAYYCFGIAFILHFLALSFTAAYDPWKGRYMISSAVYAVPFLALLFTEPWGLLAKRAFVLKTYTSIVVFIGLVSAILAVYLNERALPIAAFGRPSAFDTERMAFLTWARPDITTPYQKFNELVPQNATVALGTINDDYEYPLWGDKLTRKMFVLNPFGEGLRPIPKEAQYLFFAKSVIKPQAGDIRLGTDTTMKGVISRGEDYYLRKLK